jgi:pimeloyl-ACP methyl ester carboxylesterase
VAGCGAATVEGGAVGGDVHTEDRFAWRDGAVHWSREGDGPPVVLCHGTPWSSWLWEGITRALSPRWTVYRWDLLGYGRSEQREGQDVSLGAQGELFAALLEHWRLDAPTVIAHDYGGAVALRGHLLHGCRYAGLGLVDVVALAPWGSPFFRLVGEHTGVFTQLPAPLHEALVRAYIAGASHRGLDVRVLDQLVAPWLGPTGAAAFYRQIAQADQRFTDEVEPRYPELDLPVHIVWGAQDTWVPADRGRRLHELIPGSSFEVIEGAGHLIHLDAPEALTASLVRWLDGVP